MKALFFDLDDTLLNSQGVVTERNRQAIIQCKNRGMVIGYITVRSPRKIDSLLNGLPCDCIANYNGAMVYADGKLITQNNIAYTEAIDFMNQIYHVVPHIEMSCYCDPYSYKNNRLMNTVTKNIVIGSINDIPPYDCQRIRIVLDGYVKYNFEQYIYPSMRYQVSVHNTAIITNIKATKENALKLLMEHYDITANDIVSFGDDINDIEMLKASGIGVAMGNALDEVKKVADYITLSNNEDGVAVYLENNLLLN